MSKIMRQLLADARAAREVVKPVELNRIPEPSKKPESIFEWWQKRVREIANQDHVGP
jgi:hypothetical protein